MYTGSGTTAKQYYHANYQGSVIAMTDAAGVAIDIYTYDPHGNSTTLTGNPFRYTGRRLDAETGLYYYRARYYSPALGRFLQTDPIGYGDGLNWYAYVGNDPVNGVDPSGEFCVPCAFAVGGFVAGFTFNAIDQLSNPNKGDFSFGKALGAGVGGAIAGLGIFVASPVALAGLEVGSSAVLAAKGIGTAISVAGTGLGVVAGGGEARDGGPAMGAAAVEAVTTAPATVLLGSAMAGAQILGDAINPDPSQFRPPPDAPSGNQILDALTPVEQPICSGGDDCLNN